VQIPEQISLLTAFAKEHGLVLLQNQLHNFSAFCELLIEANKSTNLISKNDEQKIITRHIADSLMFATPFGCGRDEGRHIGLPLHHGTWVDIGSGAGFPVIPLCIYLPHIKFYAIEPRKKRCEFLNYVKQKLNLQHLEIVQSRAESAPIPPANIVSCRAVGSLTEDLARAKTILKKGGLFLTVKSKRLIEETPPPKGAKILHYNLPGEEQDYVLLYYHL